MSNPLFDISQYQSETQRSYSADWRDATATDPAWDEPNSKPNSEANTKGPAGDAPTGWRNTAEFTITLNSGQTIGVKFVPGLEGELSMHQFDFTGPVSSTGFKSHFVLAVETEEFPHPRDYAQVYAQEVVENHSVKHSDNNTKQSRSRSYAIAPQELLSDRDNSTLEPAMPEDKTQMLNHTPVSVVEELSSSESADRQRLELTVERGFYHSGKALTQLRDRRLYRSTHQKFEDYCQERFGMKRIYAHYLINAAIVFDNLSSRCSQFVNVLPTSESQCRPLLKLEADEQCQVWFEAVEMAERKVPSGRIVKDAVLRHVGIVERLKQKNPLPPEFAQGDVVEIKTAKHSPLRPFQGMCGIIEHVGSFSYTVRISITKDLQQCKGDEMTQIDAEYTTEIKAVSKRIAALVQFELEPVEYAILEVLQRAKCFTPRQLLYLERMETDFGLRTDTN